MASSVSKRTAGSSVGKPPSDHYIEQLREDRGKKGDESGGPPAT
jgi:hypothetical protein